MQPVGTLSSLQLHHAARSDVGRKRTNNEDAYLAQPLNGIFAIADGMGGHAAGEVAAQLALSTLSRLVALAADDTFTADTTLTTRERLLGWLTQAVEAVNTAVYERARSETALGGMGCTLCVALLRGRGAFIAHVGDSRVYLRRGGVTYQLTEDHSFARELLASGVMSAQEVALHPQRNMLTRAIGPLPRVRVDTAFIELAVGDTLLLCSDGLHGEVTSEAIDSGLTATPPEQAARALVQAALDAGGRDNVTVVVVQLQGTPLAEPEVIGSELARTALAQSALFATCTFGELVRVQQLARPLLLRAGGVALEKGEPCTELFIPLTGQLSVWRAGQQLGLIGPGDPFGAMALIPEQATVTCRAESDALILVFPLAELGRVLATDPTLAAKLALAALARQTQRVDELSAALAKQRRMDEITTDPAQT